MSIINLAVAVMDKRQDENQAVLKQNQVFDNCDCIVKIGLSPNGKATDSDSVISRFESL